MERFLMQNLIEWKNDPQRKPLLLQGARQVGKTWLVREFGRREYENTVYINFDRENGLHDTLARTLEPGRLITAISAMTGEKITPEGTLIIFDEVQEEPRALTSLKYFCEDAPEYSVIATGSFMGIALHPGTSFPVGKVDHMTLYPLSFREFLCASDKAMLNTLLEEKDIDGIQSLKALYIELLRSYYAVGGMPEVVAEFLRTQDYNDVREKQLILLDFYRMDFSKHAEPRLVTRLNQVWDSIPSQLARENRKFMFGQIRKGARAKDFELALLWLSDCGLIHLVNRVSKSAIPLKAYEEMNIFKVFLHDVGLLGALGNLAPSSIIEGNRLFEEFKGALSEQYVLSQMISDMGIHPYYYSTDNSRGEIDFLIQKEGQIIPVEVKAEENLRARSLRAFVTKHPSQKGARISMSDYREQDWMVNYPLYAFMTLM